jgi:hypothetical protein
VPTLRGELLVLRPVAPPDRDARQRLGYHAEIERGYGVLRESGAMTQEEAGAWYDSMVADGADPSRMAWVIEAGGELAGMAFLQGIRDVDAKARFAIGLFSPT